MGSVEDTVKCLVWDLDQTLWHGILLEGGEPELSDAVRDVILGLDSRGILQSVASRNDHEQAWVWLEKLNVSQYFVLPRIGWGRKSDSVREIADQLGFAYRTIAFIDDQPSECAEVAFHLPDVRCYSAAQATSLLALPEFSPSTVTEDARNRRRMYHANFQRDVARAEYCGADEDFLRSLELVMGISRATETELTRVEELTLRTSQMNATGVHYSDAALRALLAHDDHEVLVVTLTDRFGPYGGVGVMLLERHPSMWHLQLLATSCRVVALGVGSALLRWLSNQASIAQVHLVADFRKTDRNRMMEIAYRFAGFTDQFCECRNGLGAAPDPGEIQRLHLVPAQQSSQTAMRMIAPDLGAPSGGRDG